MKLQIPTHRQMKLVKKLYAEAFPKEEKKPFWLIERQRRKGKIELLTFTEEDFKGFVITMLHGNSVLLDYFAVHRASRGSGCGSKALELLKKRYDGKKIILEIEPLVISAPNYEQRVKRKIFYHRNGFQDTGILVSVFGAPLELLTCNCQVTLEEYKEIYRYCYGRTAARILRIREISL